MSKMFFFRSLVHSLRCVRNPAIINMPLFFLSICPNWSYVSLLHFLHLNSLWSIFIILLINIIIVGYGLFVLCSFSSIYFGRLIICLKTVIDFILCVNFFFYIVQSVFVRTLISFKILFLIPLFFI